jgi:hypothetical protein
MCHGRKTGACGSALLKGCYCYVKQCTRHLQLVLPVADLQQRKDKDHQAWGGGGGGGDNSCKGAAPPRPRQQLQGLHALTDLLTITMTMAMEASADHEPAGGWWLVCTQGDLACLNNARRHVLGMPGTQQ